MVDSFSEVIWFGSFVDGLHSVRRVTVQQRAAEHRTEPPTVDQQQEEDQALRAVGDHPAFARFGPALPKARRGMWVFDRVTSAVDLLREDLPAGEPTSTWSAPDKAVLLWIDTLSLGLRPEQLADSHPELLPGRGTGSSKNAAAGRVRSMMWLKGSRPSVAATEGIQRVYLQITGALQRADTGTPALVDMTFDYEWNRLTRTSPSAEQQLLVLLAQLAPDVPVALALLERGGEALPWPLRRVVGTGEASVALVEALARRGLVAKQADCVTCSTSTRFKIRGKQTESEQQEALATAVRFLHDALPADTHFYAEWPLWRAAEPHVRSVVAAARDVHVRLGDAAWVLDRMAVYLRETGATVAAVTASEQAVALSDEAQRPNLVFHGVYLGNLAMALRRAGRLDEAVRTADEAVAVAAQSVGVDDEEYASSLNFKANILAAARRYVEAEETHRAALDVMRAVMARRPEQGNVQYLVEILNDAASVILGHGQTQQERQRALDMLDEAAGLADPEAHGWTEIMWNRAVALYQLGHLRESASLWPEIAEHAQVHFGDPSRRLLAVLRNFIVVLEKLGHPDADAVARRADAIEEALELDAQPDTPRSADRLI
jgi:tetratricopeptide (TPR) repeat protein